MGSTPRRDSGARRRGRAPLTGAVAILLAAVVGNPVPHAALATPGCSPGLEGEWLTGDTHVHTDHSYDGSLPRQSSDDRDPGNLSVGDQIGQAEKMGLDFLPLTDHYTYDQQWDPLWTSSELILIPGEESSSPHMPVLGAVDQMVDGANPPGAPRFRHLQQTVWDAHAQNAIVSQAHPDGSFWTGSQLKGPGGAEPTEDASLIGTDLVEVWNKAQDPEAEIDYAEDRWNRGFRFGVAGASDNHWREVWAVAGPGQPATHVFAADRSERSILDALSAGRTTISATPTAPFTSLTADTDGDGAPDAVGGDEIAIAPGTKITLHIEVTNGAGSRVLLYQAPGRAAGPLTAPVLITDRWQADIPVTTGDSPTWFRVEVRGAGLFPGALAPLPKPDYLLAATSPLFVSPIPMAEPQPEVTLPADTGTPGEAVPAIGLEGCFAGFPDVASAGGMAHVVAEQHRGGTTSIVYRRLTGNDGGEPAVLAAGSARWPRVAAAGNDVWVVWVDERSGQSPRRPDIYLRHSANAGISWEPEIRLTNGTGLALHPDIALLPDGAPIVVWSANPEGPFEVFAQVLGEDAAAVSSPGKSIQEGDGSDPRTAIYPASIFPTVTVGDDGAIAVGWQDNRFDPDPGWTGHTPRDDGDTKGTGPDNWEVLVAVRPADEPSWSEPERVSANENVLDRHPAIAFGEEDQLVAVWEQRAMDKRGANLSLMSSTSADLGATWSPLGNVALDANAMAQRPQLDGTEDDIRVVWYDSRSSDWRWRVLLSELTGSGWEEPEILTGPGNATWPALSGDWLVFTTDRNAQRPQRDPTHQVYARRLK